MNEQRVKDLIEHLKRFDGDTRISSTVEFKWNDKRTAVEIGYNKENEDLKSEVETLKKNCLKLEGEIEELNDEVSNLTKENDGLEDENSEMKLKLEKIRDAL